MRKARARMLSPTISSSERISRLDLKSALFYTWLIAHVDDQGRHSANARVLKAIVMPLIDDITIDDVEKALGALEREKLIVVYRAGNERLLQMLDWWEYQRLQHARASKHAPPDGWSDHVVESADRDDAGRFEKRSFMRLSDAAQRETASRYDATDHHQ